MSDSTITAHGKEQSDISTSGTEVNTAAEIVVKAETPTASAITSNTSVLETTTPIPTGATPSFTAAITSSNGVVQPSAPVPAPTPTPTPTPSQVPAIAISAPTAPIVNPVLTAGLPTLNLTLPIKTKRDTSVAVNDPWTYAQINLSDVVLKPRSADQPSDSRDFVVGSIKGVDVSNLKYNDLRKICVRLRLPNYKNQNKDGMLQLITIAKMKQEGVLPEDFEGEYIPMGGPGIDPRMHGMRTVGSSMTAQSGMLHEFANNAAMTLTGKRKRQDQAAISPGAMKKIDGSSKLQDAALHSAAKLDGAKLCIVNFELFTKVSDRIRVLRKALLTETNEDNKKEIEEEMIKLKTKKTELNSQI